MATAQFADVEGAIADMMAVRKLGSGAMGEVKLMVHVPTRRAYALKTQTSNGFSGGVQRRVLIAQEIACMREASSPFLMRFYGEMDTPSEHAIDPDVSSMLLEHLGGGSLEVSGLIWLGLVCLDLDWHGLAWLALP